MTELIKRIKNYIINIFRNNKGQEKEDDDIDVDVSDLKEASEELENLKKEQIIVRERSIINKLYSLEQQITTFKDIFPNEYSDFSARLDTLKKEYEKSLSEYLSSINEKRITYEIDPDFDSKKLNQVILIEKEITFFINDKVKYAIITKRIQVLIVKLNILYNTSIIHCKDSDKEKVMSQLEFAKDTLLDIIEDSEDYHYFESDKVKRMYLTCAISYCDFIIFKCICRNLLNPNLKDEYSKLFTQTKFKGIDTASSFITFILEELGNLSDMIEKYIVEENYRIEFNRRIVKLKCFDYDYVNVTDAIFDKNYFEDYFSLENEIINCILLCGVDKKVANIKIIKRFDVKIDEKEIFFSVKSQACLALSDIAYRERNICAIVVIEFIKNLSDDITYKDIYFILILFGLYESVINSKKTNRSFVKNIKKQEEKYENLYSVSNIEEKKKELLRYDNNNKKYIKLFSADKEDLDMFVKALKKYNLDIAISDDIVWLNAFYFQGFKNILKNQA